MRTKTSPNLIGSTLALAFLAFVAALFAGCLSESASTDMEGGGSQTGRTGSMARFQVVGDHLYALSGNSLQVYGIADPAAISFQNSVDVGFGIETLFARGSHLYIGSETGMFIYSIADRTLPVKTSQVSHFRSCDPVVVEGSLAFVTLRSGGARCWNGSNELQIHDVSDPAYPVKLKTYPMANPHGLGTDGDLLFLCDGYAGLKVYRVGADRSLSLVERVDGIETYDVIPRTGSSGKIAILIAREGVYQYDYGVKPMKELSVIKIGS